MHGTARSPPLPLPNPTRTQPVTRPSPSATPRNRAGCEGLDKDKAFGDVI
jgi:hypothetical protein